MKEFPSQGTPGGGSRASLPAAGRLGESRLRPGVLVPWKEMRMSPLETTRRLRSLAPKALCRAGELLFVLWAVMWAWVFCRFVEIAAMGGMAR